MYKLIDLKGIALSSVAVTIPGIYEAIESTNKVTVLHHLVIGETELDDSPVLFTVDGQSFTGIVGGKYTITVTAADAVTGEEV